MSDPRPDCDDDDAEARRILALLEALMADPAYVDGETPFPGTLTVADARLIAADVHASVDAGTAKRAELIVKQGRRVACHEGCNACCEQLVLIWAAEAELIAEHLRAPENAAAREAFLAAYPAWLEGHREGIAAVRAAQARRDSQAQLAALMAQWKKRVMCAFNRDGRCTIYAVRPTLCRNAHAIDRDDLCHPATATSSAALSMNLVPLEEFIVKTRRLAIAMHHALGGVRRQPEALCEAVYRRLSPDDS